MRLKPAALLEYMAHIDDTVQVLIDTVCDLSVSVNGGPPDDGGGNVIQLRRAA